MKIILWFHSMTIQSPGYVILDIYTWLYSEFTFFSNKSFNILRINYSHNWHKSKFYFKSNNFKHTNTNPNEV